MAEPQVMRNLRIMLADDHETVRQGLRELFKTVPEVEVVHDVGDGESALQGLRTLAPDLIVIDLSMMPTDGITLMKRIQEARRNTKVVVLTRYRELGYVREALAAGALGYVLKQSPFSELHRAVLAAARGEQHLDPRLWTSLSDGVAMSGARSGPLSDREVEVLRRAARGQTQKEIGAALQIAVKTVEVHKSNAMKKLGLRDRAQVVRYAVLHGWLLDA